MTLACLPGDQRKDRDGKQAAHEDRLSAWNVLPEQLDAHRHAGEENDRREFQSDAKDRAVTRGLLGVHERSAKGGDGRILA